MGLKDVVGGLLKVLSKPAPSSGRKSKRGAGTGKAAEHRRRAGSSTSGSSSPKGPQVEGVTIEYTPTIDGDPDPGEVVWTWVAYEDDPSQGKDRPVVIIGRKGSRLGGVALTSKDHDRDDQVPVGTGPWDSEGRPSFAKIDNILDIDPDAVRREGSVLDRKRFDALVAAVADYHGVSIRR